MTVLRGIQVRPTIRGALTPAAPWVTPALPLQFTLPDANTYQMPSVILVRFTLLSRYGGRGGDCLCPSRNRRRHERQRNVGREPGKQACGAGEGNRVGGGRPVRRRMGIVSRVRTRKRDRGALSMLCGGSTIRDGKECVVCRGGRVDISRASGHHATVQTNLTKIQQFFT